MSLPGIIDWIYIYAIFQKTIVFTRHLVYTKKESI